MARGAARKFQRRSRFALMERGNPDGVSVWPGRAKQLRTGELAGGSQLAQGSGPKIDINPLSHLTPHDVGNCWLGAVGARCWPTVCSTVDIAATVSFEELNG